ncbi:hypothetical protein R5Q06_00605 [Oenococcus oeni]
MKVDYVESIRRWVISFPDVVGIDSNDLEAYRYGFAKMNQIDIKDIVVVDGEFNFVGTKQSKIFNRFIKSKSN